MWLDKIENKERVSSIYGQKAPSLDGIVVKELRLNYNGPIAELVVELNEYPLNPPKKWSLYKFNKVDIVFQLIDVKGVSIKEWNCANNSNLSILEGSIGLVIKATGDCEFELNANWVRVESISAYRSDD